MKKVKPQTIEKRVATSKAIQDRKEIEKQKLIQEIKEESKNMLLPNLKEKMQGITNQIVTLLKDKDINNIQIMSIIAKGSLLENALGRGVGYTPQELSVGFDLYLDMINKINEVTSDTIKIGYLRNDIVSYTNLKLVKEDNLYKTGISVSGI